MRAWLFSGGRKGGVVHWACTNGANWTISLCCANSSPKFLGHKEGASLSVFDHLAVAAVSLDEGAAAIEAALGVPLQAGGKHAAMGTHNRLLSLGPGEYLEVIAIDPGAPAPARARWFGLDGFAGTARPRAWILRCADLDVALVDAPEGSGLPVAF